MPTTKLQIVHPGFAAQRVAKKNVQEQIEHEESQQFWLWLEALPERISNIHIDSGQTDTDKIKQLISEISEDYPLFKMQTEL